MLVKFVLTKFVLTKDLVYYKMCESTLSSIVNFEENIDLSHIHLAVQVDMAVESGPEHMYQRKPGSLTPTWLQ